MKAPDFTLSFLDMVFSLFAVVSMLVVLLAIIRGDADYELDGDFIVVKITWSPELRSRNQNDFRAIVSEPAITAGTYLPTVLQSTSSPDDSTLAPLQTILVVPSVNETLYRLESAHGARMSKVTIATRAGEKEVDPPSQGQAVSIRVRPAQ